jgi:integrase
MYVKQRLSILFYPVNSKENSEGTVPIFVRVTIDGFFHEISTGVRIDAGSWDVEAKKVKAEYADHKQLNSRLTEIKVDLERHFDLVQATKEIATPQLVLQSYKTPLNGERIRKERLENFALNEELDNLIREYIEYGELHEKAHEKGAPPLPVKIAYLDSLNASLAKRIEAFAKKANKLLFDKNRQKTLMQSLNENLLDLLQATIGAEKSYHTLEKMACRKRTYHEFLQYHFKQDDIPLYELEFPLLKHLYTFLITQRQVIHNTATKYISILKGMLNRAVAHGWLIGNPFFLYKCTYKKVHHDWLPMEKFEELLYYKFAEKKLNVVRDCFVFASFTGFSHKELYTLRQDDRVNGPRGSVWIIKNRRKTGNEEAVPLLPIPIQVLERYKNHPHCVIKQKLLPVPTVQEYNRCLKEIARIMGIRINLRTHKARFFFANEITHNNGVPLSNVGRLMGQSGIRSPHNYVKANKAVLLENMEMVEEKLFNDDGTFKTGEEKGEVKKKPTIIGGLSVAYVKKAE